jgi:hypothetical protein
MREGVGGRLTSTGLYYLSISFFARRDGSHAAQPEGRKIVAQCTRPPFEGAKHQKLTRISCYTKFVLKNVTITVEEDALRWARKQAAEKNTSVSKLVGRMLEDKMRQTDEYWAAYEKWKGLKALSIPGLAANRLTREEANERRR